MTKSDLKTGMVVKTRSGSRYMVMRDTGLNSNELGEKDILVNGFGWLSFSEYTDDLLDKDTDNMFDIIEVFKPSMAADIIHAQDQASIWKR